MKKVFKATSQYFRGLDSNQKKLKILGSLVITFLCSNVYLIYREYELTSEYKKQNYCPFHPAERCPEVKCNQSDEDAKPKRSRPYNEFEPQNHEDPLITQKVINFRSGGTYPICGRYEDVPLYDSVRGVSNEFLKFCFDAEASILGTDIPTGKLTILNDGWAQFDIKAGTGVNEEPLHGRTKYVMLKHITTPFILSDGKNDIPLKMAGLKTVLISSTGYSLEGSDQDPCYGDLEPSLVRSPSKREETLFENMFDHQNAILLQNTNIEISKHCGT